MAGEAEAVGGGAVKKVPTKHTEDTEEGREKARKAQRIEPRITRRTHMSWKNVKEHYRIKHQVHVTNEGICSGSPYVHNLIVIGLDGVLKKRREGSGNADLTRYQAEMDADPAMLKQLVMAEDSFDGPGLPVFTYDGGRQSAT